ncbi:phosphate ABC transporter permease subunit PstC [Silicimonas algicola]|uniref:Phosphate transport system permease protein n=1 Tax=Silicimonas algicola TaxID=1826607 RepID=A0A316G8A1_9RHOB|nr:phosphate ABC transporter permease subunit PstC [Silicimonas algicola]AZQ67504.1 phosphate ABC transporter permease subunit PstC [Silicimonas algicola]PWK57199.1 phosphate ABC transporter membrane protein 1 (PhoT family) [Silicimonas algicola]
MPTTWLILAIAALAALGFVAGRARAMTSAGGDARRLHSLPAYYGWNVALTVLTPALGLFVLWMLVQPFLVDRHVTGLIPDSAIGQGSSRGLVMSDVRRVAEGLSVLEARGADADDIAAMTPEALQDEMAAVGVALGTPMTPAVKAAAEAYRAETDGWRTWMGVAVLAAALGGLALSWRMTDKDFRARNTVERGILFMLLGAALVAILTTLGIVLSMLFETANFFEAYPWQKFFLGTNWAPDFRGNSELAILPLLWGTLYISLIALLVAVPIGLFAAIYLSEYATKRVRTLAKPAIEILAGIPTIVYGLFALITVGPMLRDWLAQPLGFGNSSSSVMTAGLVMGIMLIPFVSSLSDDIINAVPQSLRDGSYGLGATQSETIKQVIVPAALPGIVGAILLAASRAIGETMIVVLGAGAAAAQFNQGLGEVVNPFQAMTTITVKIVSQLTGDTDFSSPETLVAFALGLTLFVITLGLNVLALWIVRRYREQYE